MSVDIAPSIVEPSEAPTIDEAAPTNTEVAPESSAGPKDVKDMSFEEWLAHQEAKPIPEPKSTAKASDLIDSGQKETNSDQIESKIPPKQEISSDQIKIGDKVYTAGDIEKMSADTQKIQSQYQTIQRQAEQLVEILKTNPGSILEKVGASREAIEQWYYKTHIEPDLLSPEERTQRATNEELERYRADDARRKEEASNTEKEQRKEQYRQEWSNKIQSALDSSDLPKTDWVITRMANYMKQALSKGMSHIQPADVVPLVKTDWLNTQKAMLSSMTPAQLASTLGEETMTALRKADAEKYKQTKFDSKPIQGKPQAPKKTENKKRYKSAYDLLDDL